MATFLHILGSDIPHHNRTLCAFFSQKIAPLFAERPRFFVVGSETLRHEFPNLDLTFFPNKKMLAKAVVKTVEQRSDLTYFLHGQYNLWLWLAILGGKLPLDRTIWHIWGADLYETSNKWQFRLFYPIRRLAQKRLKKVCGTQGDLGEFSKINSKSDRLRLYFPTKFPTDLPKTKKEMGEFTVLLGNSGDPSNVHLQGLDELHKLQLENTPLKIVVPMGYPKGNQPYIKAVESRAESLFPRQSVEIWQEQWGFDAYLQQLAQCDFGYFAFERQQGIGTICLCIALNIPFALSRKNPFCLDLNAQGIPFLYTDEISYQRIREVKQQLQQADKSQIAFFPPNYELGWLEILCN